MDLSTVSFVLYFYWNHSLYGVWALSCDTSGTTDWGRCA